MALAPSLRLGRDPEVKAQASAEWLDVQLCGFVFRLRLALPKELRLLEALAHAHQGEQQQQQPLSQPP